MKILKLIICVPLLISCSLIDQFAVRRSAKLIHRASVGIEGELDWHKFKNSTLSHIGILESLLYLDPKNEDLLKSLVKAYSAYAFIVDETEYMRVRFLDNEKIESKNKILYRYSRGVEYAFKLFELKGVSYRKIGDHLRFHNTLDLILNSTFDREDEQDLQTVFFFAQALGGLINYQRDNVRMIGQISIVKNLFDWVCSIDPDINFGSCDLFYAVLQANRPSILGGRPGESHSSFLKIIKKWPRNLLARVLYMQYVLIPHGQEKFYKEQRDHLIEEKKDIEREKNWTPVFVSKKRGGDVRLNLYRSVAMERLNIMIEMKDRLFQE